MVEINRRKLLIGGRATNPETLPQQKADTRPLGSPEPMGLGPTAGLSAYPNINIPEAAQVQ